MQALARIGKYQLEEFLGGGMSHVYRARDIVLGRTVAVKILTEAGCADPEAKQRFLAEARMASNIAHDNILSIYDFGEDDQHRPFMVMEYLRGESLGSAIAHGHAGDLTAKLKILVQVARALEHVHKLKIVHRDIKPENVHITPAGVVKLIDFGIAKTEGLAMTRAGYVLGTPYYMAPEQVRGQNITEQVDVYAFGVLMCELIAGVKPIASDDIAQLFHRILNEPLDLEPLRRTGAPPAIIHLVTRCMNKNPAERPRGFSPVIAEIESIVASLEPGMGAGSAKDTGPVQIPHLRFLVAAIAVIGCLFAIGIYLAVRRGHSGPEVAKTLPTETGEMVLVPAGEFRFGKEGEKVALRAFYIDKTEVTNAAYSNFLKATNRPVPEGFPADQPDYPVVNVTILDARKFAAWAGKRLPNSREWEKAARGTDGRIFPWGNERDPSRANVGTSGLQPVGRFMRGASPYGALQMVGNAAELVDDLTTPDSRSIERFAKVLKPAPTRDDSWFMARGLAFNSRTIDETVMWDYYSVPLPWKSKTIGFRCVKDAQ